jgi:hypothetical protein
MEQRTFRLHSSKKDMSPLRQSAGSNMGYEPVPRPPTGGSGHAGSHYVQELLAQIETLQRERDGFLKDATHEKSKNQELEKEFIILRGLIQQ